MCIELYKEKLYDLLRPQRTHRSPSAQRDKHGNERDRNERGDRQERGGDRGDKQELDDRHVTRRRERGPHCEFKVVTRKADGDTTGEPMYTCVVHNVKQQAVENAEELLELIDKAICSLLAFSLSFLSSYIPCGKC